MNQHHDKDRKRFQVQAATTEELGIEIKVKASPVFEQVFLAHRRAHYTAMARKPRNREHRRFCLKELRMIDLQQRLGKGYTKIIVVQS